MKLSHFPLSRSDLENFASSGVLSRLTSVFSRDDDEPEIRYVQHAMKREGKALAEVLLDRPDSVVYVCGDAANMARDVNDALVEIISQARGE